MANKALLSDVNMAKARASINDAISDCFAALSSTTCEAKDLHIRIAKKEMSNAWNCLDAFIRAGLEAPTRNVDRFATLDEAREAFQKERGHKVWADVELWDSMDEAGAFVRWLFARVEGERHA